MYDVNHLVARVRLPISIPFKPVAMINGAEVWTRSHVYAGCFFYFFECISNVFVLFDGEKKKLKHFTKPNLTNLNPNLTRL